MARRDRSSLSTLDPREEEVPRAGFFVWLGGGDAETIAAAPRERHKFTGVGGVVLMTACMATASCTFALSTALRVPVPFAVLIGLFWGAGIMNLDRWLVTATVRRPKWQQNLALAMPRFILALIVGVVISTPLVLWIFQREINTELVTTQQQKRDAFELALKKDPELSRIPTDQANVTYWQSIVDGTNTTLTDPTTAIKQLQQAADADYKTWQHWQDLADCERDGRPQCSSGVPGKGPNWRDDEARANDFKAVYEQTEAQLLAAQSNHGVAIDRARQSAQTNLAAVQKDLSTLLAEKAQLTAANNAELANDNGLLARLEALSKLTDTDATLKLAYIALLLFITAIEVMPVFAKFLMSLGGATLYDDVLAIKDRARTDAAKAEAEMISEVQQAELGERKRLLKEAAERKAQAATPAGTRRMDGEPYWPDSTYAPAGPDDGSNDQTWHVSVPSAYVEGSPPTRRRRWGRGRAAESDDDYGAWSPSGR